MGKQGKLARWYLTALGTEVDLHTPHWHGNTLINEMKQRSDVEMLMPASMKTLDMVPENPGTWLYHCHVNDHISAGMSTTYTVLPCDGCTDKLTFAEYQEEARDATFPSECKKWGAKWKTQRTGRSVCRPPSKSKQVRCKKLGKEVCTRVGNCELKGGKKNTRCK